MADDASLNDLRAEAKSLGLSGGGSKEDLAARIAAARDLSPEVDGRQGDSVTVTTLAGPDTVWMGAFHVEVGSEAHRALVERGFEPGPAPAVD